METGEELHSFPFEETINGHVNFYRITEFDNRYAVEKDGLLIAEVAHDEQWRQVAGNPLNEDLLGRIYDCIEDHYY